MLLLTLAEMANLLNFINHLNREGIGLNLHNDLQYSGMCVSARAPCHMVGSKRLSFSLVLTYIFSCSQYFVLYNRFDVSNYPISIGFS